MVTEEQWTKTAEERAELVAKAQAWQGTQREFADAHGICQSTVSKWLKQVGDDTTVLIMSDHGAKRMDGGICINEWFMREGLQALSSPVTQTQNSPHAIALKTGPTSAARWMRNVRSDFSSSSSRTRSPGGSLWRERSARVCA